jgi:tryptophan-rich sensory protein
MKRLVVIVAAAVLLACSALGCGSDRDKGIYSNRDKPQAEPAAGR